MKKIVLICILILLIAVVCLNNCKNEGFANSETTQETTQEAEQKEIKEILWENKLLLLEDVVENLQQSLSECGVSNLGLDKTDFSVIDSRKRLVELLPVTKLLDKVTYEQVQCFVSKFDPENYLVIGKTISTVPKVLRPKNIVIVNDILYNSTPYGVVKYKIPSLSAFSGLKSLNASIECGVLNDFNTYNMSTEPIFHLEGRIIQKRGDQFVDIKNNDNYEITDINSKIELLNRKIINKIQTEKTQGIQVQNKIVQENKIITEAIKAQQAVTAVQAKVVEKMVDIGGLIELKVEDHKQLKKIDSKTFLPVVTPSVKAEQEIRPEVIVKGEIVLSDGRVVSEAQVKQEIKQELASKGVPVSEQDLIAAKKLAALKALEESKVKSGPVIQAKDVDISKLINTLVSVFEYDGIIYMTDPNVVRPFSTWANKVNELLAKNKLQIKGVIPHFYHLNNVFNYRLIFILSDDFYIWVNKENVSGVLDIKKEWNITFNPNIPDTLPCDELKIILEQMQKANVITKEKSDLIIKNYRC